MRRLLILTLVLMLLSSACNNSSDRFEHQLSSIDSLEAKLDVAASDYLNLNIDSIVTMKTNMDDNLEEISRILLDRKDTMSFKNGVILSNYKSAGKVFRKSKEVHMSNIEAIDNSKKQLSDLRNDLKNGAITDSLRVVTYLLQEDEFVNKLISDLERRKQLFENGKTLYTNLNPKVIQFLDSLKKGNNN